MKIDPYKNKVKYEKWKEKIDETGQIKEMLKKSIEKAKLKNVKFKELKKLEY